MSKPIIHARSSAKKWGGSEDDYFALHDLMDSSKGVLADNRHRLLTHHSWFGFIAEKVMGHTIVSSQGRKVSTRDLVEQHLLEDFSNKFQPTAADYLVAVSKANWMSRNDHQDVADIHARESAKEFGGSTEDYLEIHRLINKSQEAFGDSRHRALTHHSWFVAVVERIVGESVSTKDGLVPTRLVGEQHLRADLGFVPSAQEWLETMNFHDWFNNGVHEIAPSARKVVERRKTVKPGKIFAFNLD